MENSWKLFKDKARWARNNVVITYYIIMIIEILNYILETIKPYGRCTSTTQYVDSRAYL